VPLTGGSGHNAQGDFTVSGGAVIAVTITSVANASVGLGIWPGGTGYQVTGVLGVSNANLRRSGSGFSISPSAVYAGQTNGGGNYSNAIDCNHNSYTDPNRTAGSYYATIAGATANATATSCSIASGVLTVVGTVTGTLNVNDAVICGSQSVADYIKSFGTGSGGTGTYNLAGTESVASGTLSTYTTQQLITAMRNNNKVNWNSNLTGCAFAKYMQAGFGVTNPGC
jgi:hypothetical protein